MSALPALCNICCICLEHLLLQGRNAGRVQIPEESRSEMRKKAKGNEEEAVEVQGGGRGEEGSRGWNLPQRGDEGGRRKSEDTMMDIVNGRAQLPLIQTQIPSTLTQVYLTLLDAFLSRDPCKRGRKDTAKTMTLQQR